MSKGRARGSQPSRSAREPETETEEPEQEIETEQETDGTEHETTEAETEEGEGSTPRVKTNLHPSQIWFKTSSTVVRDVTRSIKAMYKASGDPVMNWGETPESVRQSWFRHFKNSYKWDASIEDLVYNEFADTCQRRLPQIIYDAIKRPPKGKEVFIGDNQFNTLKEKRSSEKFKKRSETQASNRRQLSEDGKLMGTHHGGSMSTLARVRRMITGGKGKGKGKEKEVFPSPAEVFFETHSKVVDKKTGARSLTSKKDNTTYEKYQEAVRNAEEGEEEVDLAEVWKKSVGVNRGHVYGLGAAQRLFYDSSSTKGKGHGHSSGFEGGLYSALEAQNKALQAQLLADREERLKEREEYIRETQESKEREKLRDQRQEEYERRKDAELQDLRNMILASQNCTNMFNSQPRDPRDPGNGGGNSTSLPVYH